MSKSPKKTTPASVEFTEQQLKEQIEAKRKEREAKLIEELNEWLKKNNAVIIPSADVVINNQRIGVTLKAL
jgi:hypothetical protein